MANDFSQPPATPDAPPAEPIAGAPVQVRAAPAAGRFRVWQLACWLPVMGVLGVLVAWGAVATQAHFAPSIIFPLVVGVLLGGLCVLLMRICRAGHRPTVLGGAVWAMLLTVIGQHYICYLQSQWRAEASDIVQKGRILFPELRPVGFGEYLRQQGQRGRPIVAPGIGQWKLTGGWAYASWGLDAILLVAPAMVLVLTAARMPYCNRCQTWYHTMRGKHTDLVTARRLAALAGVTGLESSGAHSVRYRLIGCDGACGPAGLALFWSDPRGEYSSGYVWLDPSQRNNVLEILSAEE